LRQQQKTATYRDVQSLVNQLPRPAL